MLIFWEQRLVFLATPKAGSSAVETALEPLASVVMQRPAELKHMSAVDFHRHIGPCLSERAGAEFTTVALMREPIEWLRSWYRFRLRDDYDDPRHPMSNLSFDAFARDYISTPQPAHAAVGTQSEILTDANGKLLVDQVFRYEAIDQFVQFLEDRLDCAITLPRVNVPPAVDVKLSPQTEAALRITMTRDIELYRAIG